MNTPTTPTKDMDFTPTAPKKDTPVNTNSSAKFPMPRLDFLDEPVDEVSKRIDFAEEEKKEEEYKKHTDKMKHCDVFANRLEKFIIDAIVPILSFEDLITDVDYDIKTKKPTEFICNVMSYIKNMNNLELYSNIIKKYGNIKFIAERALVMCPDNAEINNNATDIIKYLPIVSKLVEMCQKELETRIPTCIRTGRESHEDYHLSDIPDKDYYQKYLKYKQKYLELKNKLSKK